MVRLGVILSRALLLCVAGGCTGIAWAERGPEPGQVTSGPSAPRWQRLHDFMEASTQAQGYPGAVTLVMRDGEVVDYRAYGHRDLARQLPMQKDSIFRIYSMTKTVASVAVLMLLEEGRIGLDDPIARHLPEFAAMQVVGGDPAAPTRRAAARPISIRHLLTHTAGFPAGLPGDAAAARQTAEVAPSAATDLREFSQRLSRTPLAADPGTRFGYDGASLEVLARLVEVVGGMPFADFLQQRLFDPLQMRDTGFRVPAGQRGRVVDITTMGDHGRLVLDDGPSARHPGEPLRPYSSAAGGLYSTAADYARFCQMLLNGGRLGEVSILGRKTVELMMLNHLQLDPPVTQFSQAEGFGLGGYVVLDVAKRGQLGSRGQFGWSGAASTSYTIDPHERLVAIMLLQHLPRSDVDDLPRLSRPFYNLVYQALIP
jgi:CubicO group peptidase (beta-lactamase class C family)